MQRKQAWESSVDEHLRHKITDAKCKEIIPPSNEMKSTSQVKSQISNGFFPHGRNQTSGPLPLIQLRTFDHKNKTN